MNSRRVLIRNVAARDLLDLFVVSAVSSILIVRFFLYVMGYPSIGGTRYHIAHMLWGGLCMAAAFVLNFAFLGTRTQKMVAMLGGVGFGIFIDEVGKFVTRDNNYFYQPAVGIIYAVFVLLYMSIMILTRERQLTTIEYQMNALRNLEEAVHQDMDVHERAAVRRLLSHTSAKNIVTKHINNLLREVPITLAARRGGAYTRWHQVIASWYAAMWRAKSTSRFVRWFFVAETLLYVIAVFGAIYTNVDDFRDFFAGRGGYGKGLVVGQLAATVLSALCVMAGLGRLARSRLQAFEWFRRATLVNLLLIQFFVFSRVEFAALPGFIGNLALLFIINTAIDQETRQSAESRVGSR